MNRRHGYGSPARIAAVFAAALLIALPSACKERRAAGAPRVVLLPDSTIAKLREEGDTVCPWSASLVLSDAPDSVSARFHSAQILIQDTLNTTIQSNDLSETQFIDLFGSNTLRAGDTLRTGSRGPLQLERSMELRVRLAFPNGEIQSAIGHFVCDRSTYNRWRKYR